MGISELYLHTAPDKVKNLYARMALSIYPMNVQIERKGSYASRAYDGLVGAQAFAALEQSGRGLVQIDPTSTFLFPLGFHSTRFLIFDPRQ